MTAVLPVPFFDDRPPALVEPRRPGLLARTRTRRAGALDARIDAHLDVRARVDLRSRWNEAAGRAGLGRITSSPLGGVTMAGLPLVERIEAPTYGQPGYLIVRLRPGQLIEDLQDRADQLAGGLGVWGVRFEPRGGDFVRIDLVDTDPLARTVHYPLPGPAGHLVFGLDEVGAVVSRSLDDLTHIAVQGSNGAGKSVQAYSLLGQLARFGPLVDVVGIDPTGLLLGPWGVDPRGWRVNGTTDAAERYPAVLRELVDDMDARIATLPALRVDRLPITPATPLRVVVLEELAAISRLTGYRSSGAASETQRLVGRIASEGRKAGLRLLVISQRLGSDVLGTDTRDQLLTRMTFGCRDLATLRMLSPDATPEDLAPLALSPAGVALADLPGEPMRRIRAPYVPTYGQYCDLIDGQAVAA